MSFMPGLCPRAFQLQLVAGVWLWEKRPCTCRLPIATFVRDGNVNLEWSNGFCVCVWPHKSSHCMWGDAGECQQGNEPIFLLNCLCFQSFYYYFCLIIYTWKVTLGNSYFYTISRTNGRKHRLGLKDYGNKIDMALSPLSWLPSLLSSDTFKKNICQALTFLLPSRLLLKKKLTIPWWVTAWTIYKTFSALFQFQESILASLVGRRGHLKLLQ